MPITHPLLIRPAWACALRLQSTYLPHISHIPTYIPTPRLFTSPFPPHPPTHPNACSPYLLRCTNHTPYLYAQPPPHTLTPVPVMIPKSKPACGSIALSRERSTQPYPQATQPTHREGIAEPGAPVDGAEAPAADHSAQAVAGLQGGLSWEERKQRRVSRRSPGMGRPSPETPLRAGTQAASVLLGWAGDHQRCFGASSVGTGLRSQEHGQPVEAKASPQAKRSKAHPGPMLPNAGSPTHVRLSEF